MFGCGVLKRRNMFSTGIATVYTVSPHSVFIAFPIPFPRFHGKYDVEERLGPFSVGGGTALPCVQLHFNHCKYGTEGVLLSHSKGFEPESRT